MEKILFLTTCEEGGPSKAAREALSAALEVSRIVPGATLAGGFIGETVAETANAVAGCGASAFLGVSGPAFGVSRYGTDAAAAAALIRASGATMVVAPATLRLRRMLPGVAQRVGGRIDTQVTGLGMEDGALHLQRWYYRQRMVATLTRVHRPWLLLMAGGAFPAWEGAGGTARVEAVSVEVAEEATKTRAQGAALSKGTGQTIRPDADLLFVAGAGWTRKQSDGKVRSEEARDLILGFLDGAKASLGSSKSLADQARDGQAVLSFMSHLNQVGQTGATPRHPKGLATCCHGEEPHVVGWRFIQERRAVNLDPGCGWAQGKADVLYVADAFQVMARVNELLREG